MEIGTLLKASLAVPLAKLARALPERVFRHLRSIAVADVDRAVGGPFPATVVNIEVMAEPMMHVMAEPVMPVMAMAAVMAVTSTVTAMPTVTAASESLTWDG